MNQLRRCKGCTKFWQTHEKGCRLWKCPSCGSTKKHHEILRKRIFVSHRINPDEYDDILLKRTWHKTFGMLKGFFIEKAYCWQCYYYDKRLNHCNAKLLPQKEFGNKICGFFILIKKHYVVIDKIPNNYTPEQLK